MKPKDTPAEALHTAIQSLRHESDRGAAVLAGSMVENALGQLLERRCRENAGAKVVEKLFGPNGPISTFAQRTHIAAAFLLIDKSEYDQLSLIREIRNHFAHHPLEATFSDAYVVERERRLHFYDVATIQDELREQGVARMSYLLTCAWLLGSLQK